MKISEDLKFKKDIIQRISDKEFSERTGVHCSDLLYCLNKQALRRLMPLEPDEHEILLYSLGWSTQRWLTDERADEPSRTVDGITVTCDELWQDIPWELKCTFQSSERPIADNDSWLKQIMAQCKVIGKTSAHLTRLELAGNWKSIFGRKEEKNLPENQKPTLHAYLLEFTPEEIEDNWLWLKRRADLFTELMEGESLLPVQMALPDPSHRWECDYCRPEYKTLCQDKD